MHPLTNFEEEKNLKCLSVWKTELNRIISCMKHVRANGLDFKGKMLRRQTPFKAKENVFVV